MVSTTPCSCKFFLAGCLYNVSNRIQLAHMVSSDAVMQGFLKGIGVEASNSDFVMMETELENTQQWLDHYHLYTAVAFQ